MNALLTGGYDANDDKNMQAGDDTKTVRNVLKEVEEDLDRALIELKDATASFSDRQVAAAIPVESGLVIKAGMLALSTIILWVLAFTDPQAGRRKYWLACAFGPPGALLRWWLSWYNVQTPNFPLFTFIANMLGTTIDAVFYISLGIAGRTSSDWTTAVTTVSQTSLSWS